MQIDGAPARIYMQQEDLRAILSSSSWSGYHEQNDALGMSLDGDDVFHVYIVPPQTHFAGRPCRVSVTAVAEAPNDPAAFIAKRSLGEQNARLAVCVWPTRRGFSGVAAVLSGPRAGPASLHVVPLRADLSSRARGLLETDVLAERSVAIVGLGSGGSAIALSLAQAGIGRFVLADRDRLEASNIARHICGISDLGRMKTNAVRDVLRGKNPFLTVETFELDIVEEPDALARAIDGVDLIVAATDNDPSRFILNQLALRLGITTIFGRTLTRAAGGDVLRVVPSSGPCLACVFTKQFLQNRPREISREREARESLPDYVSEEEVDAAIQVGLASDIAPISNMMVKLALLELSRGTGGVADSLDVDLSAHFYTWANRREGAFAGLAPMGTYVDAMSVLRWYAAGIRRRPDCAVCGNVADAVDQEFVQR